MSGIPFHDDQLLLPEKRIPSLLGESLRKNLLANAFFNERDRVFTPAFEEEALVAFYKKYQITFPLPWIGGKRHLNFWVMTYVAALCSKAGPPPEPGHVHLCGDDRLSATTIRAEIWLCRTAALHEEAKRSTLAWNLKLGTYSINDETFAVPPLLKIKKGEPHVHLFPRSSRESS